jgi:regulator of sigma E protease
MMTMIVRRDGELTTLHVTPGLVEESDRLGRRQIGQLGIRGGGTKYIQRDPASAVVRAVGETWNLSATTLAAMGQMVIGTRTTDELGGPLRIAQLSGEVAQGGIVPLLWFMAVLSVNLGLINLFPIPVLDGGVIACDHFPAGARSPVREITPCLGATSSTSAGTPSSTSSVAAA